MATACLATAGRGLASGWRLGSATTRGPLAVFPIFLDGVETLELGQEPWSDVCADEPLPYVSLRQALAEGTAEVTEVSESGSVGQLRFVNRGDTRVLLLDGEQLVGAKQDRVLSTTVLVEARSALELPAACTERGRWSYATRTFTDSDLMAEREIRLEMKRSLLASLKRGGRAVADQRAVWDQVRSCHLKHSTFSPTGAMRDAYAAKRTELEDLLAAFPCADGQVGVLVLHGKRAFLDLVSDERVYAEVHSRLLRSFVFEALVSDGEPSDQAVAEAFLDRIAVLQGEPFESVGLGRDWRYSGGGIVGHTLKHEGRVVHASFFETASGSDPDDRCHRDETWVRDMRERPTHAVGQPCHLPDPPRGDAAGVALDSVAARALRLADYVRSLPDFEFTTFDVPYHHMGALLTDAILQGQGVRYSTCVVPRVRRLRREHPEARTTSAFCALLAVSDPHLLLHWRGVTAITRVVCLTELLVEEGVETEEDLLTYVERPGCKDRVTAISGITDKSFAYLRFLAGTENAVAVDRHLRRHLARAGVLTRDFDDAVSVYREAAVLLRVSAATLEHRLFSRGTSPTRTLP